MIATKKKYKEKENKGGGDEGVQGREELGGVTKRQLR
jgi:hypothetical protein